MKNRLLEQIVVGVVRHRGHILIGKMSEHATTRIRGKWCLPGTGMRGQSHGKEQFILSGYLTRAIGIRTVAGSYICTHERVGTSDQKEDSDQKLERVVLTHFYEARIAGPDHHDLDALKSLIVPREDLTEAKFVTRGEAMHTFCQSDHEIVLERLPQDISRYLG